MKTGEVIANLGVHHVKLTPLKLNSLKQTSGKLSIEMDTITKTPIYYDPQNISELTSPTAAFAKHSNFPGEQPFTFKPQNV